MSNYPYIGDRELDPPEPRYECPVCEANFDLLKKGCCPVCGEFLEEEDDDAY